MPKAATLIRRPALSSSVVALNLRGLHFRDAQELVLRASARPNYFFIEGGDDLLSWFDQEEISFRPRAVEHSLEQ